MSGPRYAIGIDLGTTNCTLAYVDLAASKRRVAVLPVPQLDTPRTVVDDPLLPSYFCYATEAEIAQGELDPLTGEAPAEPRGYVVGALARARAAEMPGRVIHSAKSWLAHAGIDREAALLPFGSDEIPAELKLSPVEASSAYLGYLRAAWDAIVARGDPTLAFAAQRIVVTVPASFDEGAQQLTRRAAELAGYPRSLRLLEEPQAAFYAWLHGDDDAGATAATRLADALPTLAAHPATVLVVDVGGGTTDFSLFRLRTGSGAPVDIERIATSDHLLLGGDNIDLLLAHLAERELMAGSDDRLSRRQWSHLLPQARAMKETLLAGDDAVEAFRVAVPGSGGGLFAGALGVALPAARVRECVQDGFFPLVEADTLPLPRRSGLREMGLPYAADTAITRHLAAFVHGREVDAVLFAGGTMRPPALQQRLLAQLARWQQRTPVALPLADLRLAIAEGAAAFAALDAGAPGRIRGGYPHSVYVELQRDPRQAAPALVCVLPQGVAEGTTVELPTPEFDLVVNRPVRFSVHTSARRPADAPGALAALDPTAFHALPPLQTTIVTDAAAFNPRTSAAETLRVTLAAGLNELGVLELALVERGSHRRFRLEFNLRRPLSATTTGAAVAPPSTGVGDTALAAAQARIDAHYGKKQPAADGDGVKGLARELERILGQERSRWNTTLLRSLWPVLHPGITRRGRSLAHETSWLYLAGFVLRPGYGAAGDPWAVQQLWECHDLGLAHRKEKSAQANWWMMWRRVAGGLPAELQQTLFAAALPELRRSPAEFVEGTRLLGSLERVALGERQDLASWLIDFIAREKAVNQAHTYWTLARLLGRVPLYTSADTVVPPAFVEAAFARLSALDWRKPALAPLNGVFASACRRTGLRSLDIDDAVRADVVDKLRRSRASNEDIRRVREYAEVSAAERDALFGEALPAGLVLAEP